MLPVGSDKLHFSAHFHLHGFTSRVMLGPVRGLDFAKPYPGSEREIGIVERWDR